MKNQFAPKTTEEQQMQNNKLAYHFIMGIMNLDEQLFLPYMKDEYTYIQGRKKWQALKFFKTFFEKMANKNIEINFDELISMDVYPGCIAYKFIFSEMESENPFRKEITIVPVYENGFYKDFAICKKSIQKNESKKLMLNN